jgi:spore coat polysaccharide biosynthesis protein SpsF
MRRVAIVQARMTSTRLPGKVLRDLMGTPMLSRQLARIRRARRIDAIVLATTTNATDDPVADLGRRESVFVHRGSEDDVLARYVGAAREAKAEVIVRVTADCPLIDGVVLDTVVAALEAEPLDYASNVLGRRTYPRGLDVEAFHADVLERVNRLATSRPAREHVTWFIHAERPELFLSKNVPGPRDDSDLRWTVDTPEDFELVETLYQRLDLARREVPHDEIVAFVRAHPELARINMGVQQKPS